MTNLFLNPKYKGFTLLELLVAMAISGLVLGAAFTAKRVMEKNAADYERKTKVAAELSLLLARLQKDFSEARQALCISPNEFQLQSPMRTLHYSVRENFILRKERQHTDTFAVAGCSVKMFLNNQRTEPQTFFNELKLFIGTGQALERSFRLPRDAKQALDQIDLHGD